ncbi:MAG: AarF/ABC1/UbiB kinase family protein [Anaerolineales bacterium]|nr:AarF/ABC1/UbiB kinase family protein [Anaerolineales bacterium]
MTTPPITSETPAITDNEPAAPVTNAHAHEIAPFATPPGIDPQAWRQIQDTALTKEYRAQRRLEVQATFVRFGFNIMLKQDALQGAMNYVRERFDILPSQDFENMPLPERVRLMLEELGPTWIKFGQMASTKKYQIPREWSEELEKLQSNVPPMPKEIVRALIYREIGQTPEDAFDQFTYKPLGAASIGQVHRAVLKDTNQQVAIKLQRANIRANIEVDLEMMREIARLAYNTTDYGRAYNAPDMVEEFAENLLRELDYVNEGQNTITLGRNMEDFLHITVPTIYEQRSTRRMITMELIAGFNILDEKRLAEFNIDRVGLAEEFINAMTHQIVVDGFFHADPHPGNMFVKPDGTIVFLDMGMVGTLGRDERLNLARLASAMQAVDVEEIAAVCFKLGQAQRKVDKAEVIREISAVMNKYMGNQGAYDKMFGDLLPILSRYDIRMPRSLTMAMKSLSQSQDLVLQLDPSSTYFSIAERIKRYLLSYAMQPEVIIGELENRLQGLTRLTASLPNMIEEIVERIQTGDFAVDVNTPDLAKSVSNLENIANRLVVGLLLTGLTVGSALVMGIPVEEEWQVITTIGLVGFVLSLLITLPVIAYLLWTFYKNSQQR